MKYVNGTLAVAGAAVATVIAALIFTLPVTFLLVSAGISPAWMT